MHDIIVITGTDFGVGKTWVACALARSLATRHNEVVAVKLADGSGTAETGSGIDATALADATGQGEPRAALFRYPDPPPATARDATGEAVAIDAMLSQVRHIAARGDVMLAEGTGGLLTPLTWDCTLVDISRRLGAMAVVVAPDRRGALNHALLTLRVLAEANVNCLGVAINAFGDPDSSTGSNAAALRKLAPGTRVIETNVAGWEQRLV